jgi:hypothetical protein
MMPTHCSFRPDMPPSLTPGSSIIVSVQNSDVDIGLRHGPKGSALAMFPQSVSRQPIVVEDGACVLPNGPGLGVELDPVAQQAAQARSATAKPLHAALARRALLLLDTMAPVPLDC